MAQLAGAKGVFGGLSLRDVLRQPDQPPGLFPSVALQVAAIGHPDNPAVGLAQPEFGPLVAWRRIPTRAVVEAPGEHDGPCIDDRDTRTVYADPRAQGKITFEVRRTPCPSDDEIRIVRGIYAGRFVYDSREAKALSLLGGYATGCDRRDLDSANTILTGNGKEQVLFLQADQPGSEGAALLVQGLTIRDGLRTDGGGSGLLVAFQGAVHLDRNTIQYNRGGGAAAISLSRRDTAVLTGNLISDNTSSSGGGGLWFTTYDTGPITITLSGNIKGRSALRRPAETP
ncbi:right-handed parallel beta-helix repeat-containing protein [Thiocapsa sp.]|uniref:right-handed parallel beta-helix repeat-containing protein n=1 Tax=Thiocapsa sp. TaxID=2024551 RepID=UPI002BBC9F12|nr:right-handed parallel beta-helix repeat-containing protein [Thiocapsa sp.]HSO81363.1 right-handed parallel beta-helix repeat-containing protein [Thiocapsa sp.]